MGIDFCTTTFSVSLHICITWRNYLLASFSLLCIASVVDYTILLEGMREQLPFKISSSNKCIVF